MDVKILIFPMYPQYSATTTASVMDRLFEYLKQTRWQPTVRVVPPYYDDKIYIDALSSYLNRKLKQLKIKPKSSMFLSWYSKKVFSKRRPLSLSLC